MPGGHYYSAVHGLLRVCSVPGCPELTAGSRCSEHGNDSDSRGRAWHRQRELILERDEHRCQAVVLGASPSECAGRLECHHILEVQVGGTDDPANLAALCRRHNNQARRARPPRWARDLEALGPPALRARAARPRY